ncbi:MAG: type IV pilus twitching motility protein PilT [Geminicoccaceae bacterium]|nr:type IV pilus twitching motility protein PilT [Geminicoccaceae bacterium]
MVDNRTSFSSTGIRMDIDDLFRRMEAAHASDMHLCVGEPAVLRCDGELRRIDGAALGAGDITAILGRLMTEAQHHEFENEREVDFAVDFEKSRFRVNAFHNRQGPALVLRHIQSDPPALADLGTPDILARLTALEKGLILVTGPTGSGKSSTLAAMIRQINESSARHVITVEDPIEFIHTSKRSLITQREVGRDTASFRRALRSALREDPDVILVGELRDHETIGLALTAAETGHLVLGTLHTTSAHRALLRIVDAMPAAERDMARTMLATSLQAVIAQTLLPKTGGGRVGAYEILIGTHAVRHMIQENQPAQIYSAMQIGSAHGMQTMTDAVGEHVRAARVDPEIARELILSLGDGQDQKNEPQVERRARSSQPDPEPEPAAGQKAKGWSF